MTVRCGRRIARACVRPSRKSRGRVMLTAALACVAFGLVGIASILLTPRPAVSSAPSVDVSGIESGAFAFVRHPVDGPSGSASAKADILFIRRSGGALLAFHVPVKDGVRHAPDGSSRHPMWPCRRFEANVTRGQIECESDDVSAKPRISLWDFEGRGIAPTRAHLEKVTGHEESGAFLIHP